MQCSVRSKVGTSGARHSQVPLVPEIWGVAEIVQRQSCHTAGWGTSWAVYASYERTKKATQICWGGRGDSLERGTLRLGFDGCIGVLEFSKGGNSSGNETEYTMTRAVIGACASRNNRFAE